MDCSSDLSPSPGKQLFPLISLANLTQYVLKAFSFCFCPKSFTLQAQAQLKPPVIVSAHKNEKQNADS